MSAAAILPGFRDEAEISDEHRKVCGINCLRCCKRLARNCRQVRDKSCKEFKSRCLAISEMILLTPNSSAFDRPLYQVEKMQRTDSFPEPQIEH